MIEASQIATNRYAPAGSEAINLYSTGTAEDLTLGQLVAAVCVRTAGALEEQSINKMNLMNVGTEKLEKASVYMQEIAEETMSDWAVAKTKPVLTKITTMPTKTITMMALTATMKVLKKPDTMFPSSPREAI